MSIALTKLYFNSYENERILNDYYLQKTVPALMISTCQCFGIEKTDPKVCEVKEIGGMIAMSVMIWFQDGDHNRPQVTGLLSVVIG